MDQAEQLAAEVAQKARAVFDDSPVFLAYIHGSRVHGRPREDSDLDVGYYLEGYPSAEPLLLEELALEARLCEVLGKPVDLRDLGRAPLEFRGRVLEEGLRIYCRDEVARVNLERDLLSRYHDCKEDFRRMHETQLRQYARWGLRDGRQAQAQRDPEQSE